MLAGARGNADEKRLASQPKRCWNNLSFILSKLFEPSSVRLLTFRQCEWAEMGVGVASPSAREIVKAARADVGHLYFGESN
jgi:hypothetical protein